MSIQTQNVSPRACQISQVLLQKHYIFHLFSDNIALRKPAYQENRYTGLSEALTQASNAVDGLKTNLSVWGGQCVISGNNLKTATWWVNLTSILSIHHIRIYYRTANAPWGK